MLLTFVSQKTYYLLLLVNLYLGVLPSWIIASSNIVLDQANSIRNDIEKISTTIENDAKQLLNPNIEETANTKSLKSHINGLIILLGAVDSGKSTLINFLADNDNSKLEAECLAGKWSIKTSKPVFPETQPQEGKGTIVPKPIVDSTTGCAFYDCPGFEDLKDKDQLINAYVIKKLFSLYAGCPVRVLLVFDLSNMLRGGKFVPTIENLVKIFCNDLEKLKASISFIATKCTINEPEDLSRAVNHYIDTLLNDKEHDPLSERAKEIINDLRSSRYPLTYFPWPTQAGGYLSDDKGNVRRNDILRTAAKGQFLLGQAMCYPYPGEKGLLTANHLLEVLSDEIKDYIKGTVKPAFINWCHAKLKEGNKADEVRQSFRLLCEDLKQLELNETFEKLPEDNKFTEYSRAIQKVLTKMNLNEVNNKYMKDRLESLKLLRSFIGTRKISFTDWYFAFQEIISIAAELAKSAEWKLAETNNKNDTLKIFGILIGSKDIEECSADFIKEDNQKACKLVVVYVGHTFYCDADLRLPSVSCVIIAPNWIIRNNYKISLKGYDGEPVIDKNTHDGIPGNAGNHGGHMFGSFTTATDLDKLTIVTAGGNGGNGTNGKPGNDGKAGANGKFNPNQGLVTNNKPVDEDVSLRDIQNKYKDLYDEINKSASIYKKNIVKISYRLATGCGQGQPGDDGTDGGAGGAGGPGGIGGKVKLMEQGQEINLKERMPDNIKKSDGQMGENGKGGIGGNGGKGGKACINQYFTQLMITISRWWACNIESDALSGMTILKSTNYGADSEGALDGRNGVGRDDNKNVERKPLVEAVQISAQPKDIQTTEHFLNRNKLIKELKGPAIAPFWLAMNSAPSGALSMSPSSEGPDAILTSHSTNNASVQRTHVKDDPDADVTGHRTNDSTRATEAKKEKGKKKKIRQAIT